MSVFGAPPHTPPMAPPSSASSAAAAAAAAAVLPGGSTLGNVFPIASDASQQSSPAVYPSQFPVFSPTNQYASSTSDVFQRNTSVPVFFGATNMPAPKQQMEISPPTTVLGAARAAPPSYFFPTSVVGGHATSGSSAPVFGAASAFIGSVPPSGATGGLFSSGTAGGGGLVKNIAQPSSVFTSPAFPRVSHPPSPAAPGAAASPHDSSVTGYAAKRAQRSSLFGTPKSGGVLGQTSVESQQRDAPFASPFSKIPQGASVFKPRAVGANRGRSEDGLLGKRSAQRADLLQPADGIHAAPPAPKPKETGDVGRGQLLSTRVFTAFMRKILDNDDGRREEAAEFLDSAFFGVVGSHGSGDFPTMLQEMLSAWRTLKEDQQQQLASLKGDHWVALFAIGCNLNFVTSTIIAGEAGRSVAGSDRQRDIVLDKKWSALANSCTYANLLCDICLQLFSNQSENHVPYSALPLILRRARNTFELANDEGVSSVQPNMKTTLLKLHRYVRVSPLEREPQSVVAQQRTAAFACVLGEMMLHCCAPPDTTRFIQSFHQHCASLGEIRCTLYHHYAHNLLQEPLTDAVIQQAMELLARALIIVPDDAKANKELLFLKLTACGLALGWVSSPEEQQAYNVVGLEDLIIAVRSCNMQLFNISMRNNSELYVQLGIHNVLQVVGKRIALLMVVKYYANSFSSRLPVQDMIDYYQLPLTLQEGCYVWLLPLLVEKRINGVMESGVLVLSSSQPFDDYKKEALTALAARTGGD